MKLYLKDLLRYNNKCTAIPISRFCGNCYYNLMIIYSFKIMEGDFVRLRNETERNG